ncbi:MAG: AAA family ATPase [Planctomycetes bacterium]|nr:AAA family ATPase [Planctomycetota bacterium]
MINLPQESTNSTLTATGPAGLNGNLAIAVIRAFERPLKETPRTEIATSVEIACRNLRRNFFCGALRDYSFTQIKEELLHHIEMESPWEADSEVSEFVEFYLSAEDEQVLDEIETAGEEKESHLQALSAADVMKLEGEEIDWTIQGILAFGSMGIISGYAGLGKTWLAFELAIEAARGGSWLGKFPCRKVRVLYIDEESSQQLLRHRLGKLLAGKGIPGEGLDLHFIIQAGFNLSDPAKLAAFRQLFSNLKPDLVIVDSLIRIHQADENDAKQMAGIFRTLRELMREHGFTVLLIDHHRKLQPFGESLSQLRGSTEKAAAVDMVILLLKKNGQLEIEHAKSRYAEPVPAFIVELKDPVPGQTTVTHAGGAAEAAAEAALASGRSFVLKALEGGSWIARKALIEQGKDKGVPQKALDAAFKALAEENSLVREDRRPEQGPGGRAAYYRLAMSPNNSFHVSTPYIEGNGNEFEGGVKEGGAP